MGGSSPAAKYEDLSAGIHLRISGLHTGPDVDAATRNIMLQHLMGLMQDATDFPWEGVRNAHGIILAQIEMGGCNGRHTQNNGAEAHICQRASAASPQSSHNSSKRQAGTRHSHTEGPVFCLPYQDGACVYQGDHDTSRGSVRHICAYCLKATGHAYPHPEKKCRRKAGKQENED